MLDHTFDNTPVHGLEKVLEVNLYGIAFLEESIKNVTAHVCAFGFILLLFEKASIEGIF